MTDLRSPDREELAELTSTVGEVNPNYDPRKVIAFWQDELMKREQECARLESENERLKETALTRSQADWILAETEGWPEEITGARASSLIARRTAVAERRAQGRCEARYRFYEDWARCSNTAGLRPVVIHAEFVRMVCYQCRYEWERQGFTPPVPM